MERMAWFKPGGTTVLFPIGSDVYAESRGQADERRSRILAAWEVLAVPSVRGDDAFTKFGVLGRHASYAVIVRSE